MAVQVQSVLAMGSSTSGNPLISKLSPQHIDGLIALSSKELDRTGDDRLSSRRYSFALAVVILAIVFGFALTLALKDKDDMLSELLKIGGFAAGGFLGGYGVGRGRG
ncbi:MAG: hypothetical protein QF357_06300 [Dehalococcoidia bacterium]|jgi:hypothetical protein|nr:hypothetical protein [Dehalococcoidia bacterium]